MDIDEFENRLKMEKSRMGFDADSDSDEDERPSSKLSSKKANILSSNKNTLIAFSENFTLGYQPQKQSGSLLNDDTDLIKMVKEMHQ